MRLSPRFITVEGGEGAGKSTQIKLLETSLRASGIDVLCTREPGGSAGAEAIRKLVVEGHADSWHPTTEALLFMTARYDHLHTHVLPAMRAGKWVLCDRFYDSTYVYQGMAKGVGEAWLNQLYAHMYGNIAPDLTLLLDISPDLGLKRAAMRGEAEARFESMGMEYHARVRAGFLSRAAAEPARFETIDAAHDVMHIHHAVIAVFNERYGLALTPTQEGAAV